MASSMLSSLTEVASQHSWESKVAFINRLFRWAENQTILGVFSAYPSWEVGDAQGKEINSKWETSSDFFTK